MDRIIALDIGSKRIGIAVSDPFNTYALPVSTLHRKNLKWDIEQIQKVIKEKGANIVVCGLPVNFDGTESQQTAYTMRFIEELEKATGIKPVTVDERCTTIDAHEVLIEGGKSREERKNYVDSLAATFILEGYLSNKK